MWMLIKKDINIISTSDQINILDTSDKERWNCAQFYSM